MYGTCVRIVARAFPALIIALAVTACHGSTQAAAPSHAASTARAASTASPESSRPCSFEWPNDLGNCSSSEPDVKVESLSEGDTSGCSFGGTVNWGDGSKENFSFNGAPDGTVFDFANHSYRAEGTYAISVTDQVLSGSCTWGDMNLSFTYSSATATATAVPGQVGCTAASPSACLIASNAVAGLDLGSAGDAPAGMTGGTSVVNPDGFAGEEFTGEQGDIIIADEDADLASPFGTATAYQNGSFIAEAEIYAGKEPAALSSAVQFAQQVAAASGSAKIYVTGFGLGGAEAEAQAQALGSRISGGVTFGAPGLPFNDTASSPGAVTSIVDYGDPVGNWASDSTSQLAELAGSSLAHFGPVELTGSSGNAAQLKLALAARGLQTSPLIKKVLDALPVTPGIKKLLNITKLAVKALPVLDVWDASSQFVCYAYLADAALTYHSLAQYANDLGVSLTPTVTPAAEAADFREFDPNATTPVLQAAAATTVTASGTVTSPSYDTTASTAAGELDTETFTDPAGSQYDVTYDAAGQVSSLSVNDPGGTSYVISSDDTGQQPWSTRVYYYSGPDETGTLTGQLYNWRAGGSQLTQFTGLPPGISKETLTYSQPDAAGNPTSKSTS